jgi:hypothetical protein
MDNRRKTAIYCRTARADAAAIAAQEARLRAYADEHGYVDVIPYRDNGAAGNTLDRPAMNKLTADIKAGEIGAVLAVDAARIARTLTLMSEWRDLLDRHGVAFVALVDGGQTTAAELVYHIVGDYLLPALKLQNIPTEKRNQPLGRYARLRRAYLREHRPIEYNKLLMTERLYPHLWETDKAAANRLAFIGDVEIAHEVILSELVYA